MTATYSVSAVWSEYINLVNKGYNLNKVIIKTTVGDNICKISIPHSKNGCVCIEFIPKNFLIENESPSNSSISTSKIDIHVPMSTAFSTNITDTTMV